MSRAFVKETAEGAPPPERMVSSGPNLVTEEGLAKIAGEVERLESAIETIRLRSEGGATAGQDCAKPWSATCATGGNRFRRRLL